MLTALFNIKDPQQLETTLNDIFFDTVRSKAPSSSVHPVLLSKAQKIAKTT